MTDNEIIKALECHCHPVCCVDCPMHNREHDNCVTELWALSLDLINRQKAEIEELKSICDKERADRLYLSQQNKAIIAGQETLQKALADRNAEIEDLKKDINHYKINLPYLEHQSEDFCGVPCYFMENLVEKAKAEAIKEFAERVKTEFIQSVFFEREYQGEKFVKEIDNLVKEMVGDTE